MKFSGTVNGLTASNFRVTGTGSSGATFDTVTQVSGDTWRVTVNTAGDGALRLVLNNATNASPGISTTLPYSSTTADYTIDKTLTVSISPPSASVTAGSSVTFTVTYTGADAITLASGDVTLNKTGDATATVSVSGTGNTRTVTLSGITGNGALGIKLAANTASDTAGNQAAATADSATFQVDNTAPTVSGIVRKGPSAYSNAPSVQFTVTFSEDVTGVTTGNFSPVATGTLSGASVTGVTPVDGKTYTVTVGTSTGDGTIGLNVPASAAVTDAAGNSLTAFSGGEAYTIDRTAPTVVVGTPSPSLTATGPVSFTFTYADANPLSLSVTAAQVGLTRTGSADASVGVSTSGNTVTVTLSAVTGDGTLAVSLPAGVATDGANNPSLAAGPGAAVTVDNTPPRVSGVVPAGANPTRSATVPFTVTFDEDVTAPGSGSFAVTTTGTLAGVTVGSVTPVDARTYTVTVNTGTGDGTIRLDVKAGVADPAGNALAADYTGGTAYTVLKSAPAVAVTTPADGFVAGPTGYTGLAGSASDALGGPVAAVSVTIQRSTDSQFWDGATWAASGSVPATVTGTDWSAAFPAAAQDTGITYMVVATATDVAGNTGSSVAVSYQWDATPPAATVTLGGTYGPNTWSGSVGGTVADVGPAGVASVRVVISRSSDGFTYDAGSQTWASGTATNPVTPAGGAWSLTLPATKIDDGVTYTVTAVGVDAVGNAQSPAASTSFTYDSAAPNSAVTTPAGSFAGPLSWAASDQISGTVGDTGAAGAGGVTLRISRGSDGFFWTGSDWQHDPTDIAAAVSGGSWSSTFPASALDNDVTYTVASTATDAAGNVQTSPGSTSFAWDATAPGQTIDTVGNGTAAGPVGFTGFSGTASDGGSGVAGVILTLTDTDTGLAWNGAAFVTGSPTFPATLAGPNWSYTFHPGALADGHHYTLTAAATDLVGNTSPGTSAGFTFDASGPVVTVAPPGSTASNWSGFTGTASDPAGVQRVEYRVLTGGGLVWDGSTFGATGNWFTATGTTDWSAAFPFSNFPADDAYRVEARGVDGFGNTGPIAGADFAVTLPTVTGIALQTPGSSPSNTTGPVTWRVTFSDPVSGLTAANFALAGSFAGSAAITTVDPVGGSAPAVSWDVTARAPAAGTGTLGLNFVSNGGLTPTVTTTSAVGAAVTLDRVDPTVVITNDAGGSTIRAGVPVHYTVALTDDTAVASASLTAGDVENAVTGGVAFSVANFSRTGPAAFAFDVVPSGSGSFQLRLAAPAVTDTAGNALAAPVTDAAVITIDVTPPTVQSVVPTGTSPTRAGSVSYTVTFSEDVTGVDLGDFAVTATGGLTPGAVAVTPVSGSVYTVTVATGTGDGTLRLDVLNDGTITDLAGNPLAAGFNTAAAYAVDKTAPTATVDLDPAQAAVPKDQPIRFVVTFSEPVTGFGGVVVGGTAGAGGATVANPSGDGKTYTVTVSGLAGDGTVTITVPAGAATDAAGNELAAAVTSAAVTLDTTAPTVTAVTRNSASPTNAGSVSYTVTFSEPVTGVDAADFALVTTGLSGAVITNVGGGGATWTVDVSTGTGDGSLELDLAATATAADAAGNPLAAGGFPGEVYAVDRTGPVVTLTAPTPAVRTTPVGGVSVGFDAAVTGLTVAAFTLTRDGTPVDLAAATLNGSGAAYTLGNLAGLTAADGVYVLAVNPTAVVTDAAGNPLTVGDSVTFTVDTTAPTVSITPAVAGPTGAATIGFTVTFSEAVTGVTAGRFDVTGTAPGTSVASVTRVSGAVYTVVVNTGPGSGTVGLSLPATTAVTDLAGNAVAGLPASSGLVAVDHAAPAVSVTDADADGIVAVNVPVVYTVDVTDPSGVAGTLTAADFVNAGTAGLVVGNVSATVISGGLRFTVPVTPTTGGTVVLRLATPGTVADLAGNAPQLPVQAGRALTVDAVAPTVTVALANGQPAVTNAQPVQFAVTFGESVVGFGPGKVSLTGPGAAGAVIQVSGVGPVYFVSVSGLTEGTYTLGVPAGGVTDVAGNPNAAATGPATITIDLTPPAVGAPVLDPASDTGPADGVTAVTTPTFTGTAETGAAVRLYEGATLLGTATATGGSWRITTGALPDGPHGVFARATDSAGNAADSAATLVTVDTTSPAVTVTRAAGQGATVVGSGGTTVTFAVTTSEPVGGLDPAAASVTGTAGGTVASVSGSGSSYRVTVTGITRPGTVGLEVTAGAGSDAAGNLALAAAAGETVIVQSQPTVRLIASPADVRAGDPVGLTALVSSSASVPATGTVTFTAVGPTTTVTVVAPVSNGSAAATIPNLAGGDWTVTAAFAGTGGFLDASAAGSFSVRPAVPGGQNTVPEYAAVVGSAVTVYHPDGSVDSTDTPFTAAESPNGVRVAVADVTGDGVPDLVAGTAPGAPAAVRVIDGATGTTLYFWSVFEGFTGGVFVTAGDLTGDGRAEVIVTPDQGGGPRVLVFDGATGKQVASFLGITDPSFRGGARAAVGDLNRDGTADILVSAGFGGGPRVAGFDGRSIGAGKTPEKLFADFFLFEPGLRNGAFVTLGDVDGDGYADVIGGGGPGGAPRVLALNGHDLVTAGTFTPLADFFAGPADLRGGIRVAAKDLDGDGLADLVTGSGDTGQVDVYTNTQLRAAAPQTSGGFEMIENLFDGVQVG